MAAQMLRSYDTGIKTMETNLNWLNVNAPNMSPAQLHSATASIMTQGALKTAQITAASGALTGIKGSIDKLVTKQ